MKERADKLDLLRIVSMLMVVTLHTLRHGGVLDVAPLGTPLYFFAWTLEAFAFVAVNCFVLISGYCNLQSRNSWKRLVPLWIMTVTYSAVISAVLMLTGQMEFTLDRVLKAMFPISYYQYWYMSAYFVLMLAAPGLNVLIAKLSKREHRALLIVFTVAFSAIATLVYPVDSMAVSNGSSLVWFIYLYVLAAYIARYGEDFARVRLSAWLGLYGLFSLATVGFKMIVDFTGGTPTLAMALYRYNSITVLPASVALFCAVLNLKDRPLPGMRWIAPCCLGVYLLHDNASIRPLLWGAINLPQWLGFLRMYALIPLSIAGVFCVGILVEKARSALMAPLLRTRALRKLMDQIADHTPRGEA